MTTIAPRLLPDVERDAVAADAPRPSGGDMEGIKLLMLAVLDHAVSDFRTYAAVPTRRGKRLFADVDAWFHSSAAGPLDFEIICHAIGFDPDFIRKGVRCSVGQAAARATFPRAADGRRGRDAVPAMTSRSAIAPFESAMAGEECMERWRPR